MERAPEDYKFLGLAMTGDVQCPCLGQPILANITLGISVADVDGHSYPAFQAPDAIYPVSYGATCASHDSRLPSYCTPSVVRDDGSTTVPAWCAESWCWIDPADCNMQYSDSVYFVGSGLALSYATCGSANLFDAFISQMHSRRLQIAGRGKSPPPLPPLEPSVAPPPQAAACSDQWQQVGGTSKNVAPGSYTTGLSSMENV